MPAAANVLQTLHLIIQAGFIGVTFLLLIVTVANRLRVRRVQLSWRRGRFGGVPIWPSVFLAALSLFAAGAYVAGYPLPLSLVAGYAVGGFFWFVAGWLIASVLVTEYGVVFHSRRAERAVAWGQMVDYFEADTHFVFFYTDASGQRVRFELEVPGSRRGAFRKLAREKLDARFERTAQVYGKKALEG